MHRYRRVSYTTTKIRVSVAIVIIVSSIGIDTVEGVTIANGHEYQNSKLEISETRSCDFSNVDRMYNITDLLLCMNELATAAVAHTRIIRSPEGRDLSLVSSRRPQFPYPQYQPPSYNYPPRPESDYQSYYGRPPGLYYSGSTPTQGDNSGYYDGVNRYPSIPQTPFGVSGRPGAGLFDALTSISRYDDLKCVPRLLCEVATGVTPGKSDYNEGHGDFGGNSLIRLLTALDIGSSSPLLKFGKSALTGLTSRGDPSVCYREYPKCPRNNVELVNYLNNHNGGFFRFFGNNRDQSNHDNRENYYREIAKQPQDSRLPISGSETDRTGTGELKFDSSDSFVGRDSTKTFFPERTDPNDSNKIVFPQESSRGEHSLNRVSKSLSDHREPENRYHNPSFFPQDRKDQDANMIYHENFGRPTTRDRSRIRFSRTMEPTKARLYLPNDSSNETTSVFTFPDGQKVRINVAFSKLFSEGYKKALRRSFANDHGPQPVNFEGFSMINLAELYPNDRNRLDLQVVHPCDMICHDSKGTPVQFNQILLHSGSLSTLMTPDQPIIDLSVALPCEVMCIDRRGERRRLSTTLNQVLRNSYDRGNQPDFMGLQDNLGNEEFQWSNRQQRRRNLHNREITIPSRRLERFSFDKNVNQPSRSIDMTGQRMARHHDRRNRRRTDSMASDRGESGQPRSHQRLPKPRDTRKIDNNVNGVNGDERAASMPEGSIIIGGGPMPFFGAPMPLVSMAEMPHEGPNFFSERPSIPMGLAMSPMQGLPMPPVGGIVQSFGMMPIVPGMMGMMDPMGPQLVSGMPPSTMACPECSPGSQSPTRALMMCAGLLHFIPWEVFGNVPVCAIWVDSESSFPFETQEPQHRLTTSPILSSTQTVTELPSRSDITMSPENFQVIPVATTHKFRQPEGEDYPQLSCLEGESWNLEVHECVPIKYDKDVETDYTHLPGSPWSGVTRKPIRTHKLKKRKKLVIITDKGNITYIKSA